MSADLAPGDWVECVEGAVDSYNNTLVTGALYRIADIAPHGDVRVMGVGDCETFWLVRRFRPIYRRDEGLIQRLLRPIPAEPDLVSA